MERKNGRWFSLSLADTLPRREAGWVRELPGQFRAAKTRRAAHRGDILIAAAGRDLRLHDGERARLASPRAPSALAAHLAGAYLTHRADDGPLLRLIRRAGTALVCSRGGSRHPKVYITINMAGQLPHFKALHTAVLTVQVWNYIDLFFLYLTLLYTIIRRLGLRIRMINYRYISVCVTITDQIHKTIKKTSHFVHSVNFVISYFNVFFLL